MFFYNNICAVSKVRNCCVQPNKFSHRQNTNFFVIVSITKCDILRQISRRQPTDINFVG